MYKLNQLPTKYIIAGLVGILCIIILYMAFSNPNQESTYTAESQLLVHSLLSVPEREVRVMDSRSSIGGKVFVLATQMFASMPLHFQCNWFSFCFATQREKGILCFIFLYNLLM